MKKQVLSVLVAGLVFTFLLDSFVRADDIYVSCFNNFNGTIYKYDSSGHRTVFASGLPVTWGIAADKYGNLYTADIDSHIYKFDPSGNRTTFATSVTNPKALTFDNSGNLYVSCNYSTGVVMKFDSSGNRTTFVTGLGENPQGIAFDNLNNLYAATGGNADGTIVKFDSSGHMLGTFPGPYQPRGMMFDGVSGCLYATGSQEIIKYDLITNVTTTTTVSGGWPWGIAFDSRRNLFVTDVDKGMIYKFDPRGIRSTFASGLDHPYSIAVIPEPATLILLGLGGMILRRKR
jgi:sugar lactone lactonase YvrE